MLGFRKRDAFQSYYSSEASMDDLDPGSAPDWMEYLNGPAQKSARRSRAGMPDPAILRRKKRRRTAIIALVVLVALALLAGAVVLTRYLLTLWMI